MEKKPVLVVMAAGMGSRYGGLKQIDPVGSHGEAILDFSLFDAHEAGFETAVIIIKEAIRQDFMDTVGKRLEKSPLEIRYAFQELHKLPEGHTVPDCRTKPWGTGHAVLCAKDVIGDAPFAVINSDDYYGKEGFKALYQALCHAADGEYCMVGYELGKTVTDNGYVARGVCTETASGYLHSIVERTKIMKGEKNPMYTEDDGLTWHDLCEDDIVSMNLWGFQKSYLDEAWAGFPAFLDKAIAENPLKGEYFLPTVVSNLLSQHKARVKVLRSNDKWYGVTYKEDKPSVMEALKDLRDKGVYPEELWG